jgi:hypothetical protein
MGSIARQSMWALWWTVALRPTSLQVFLFSFANHHSTNAPILSSGAGAVGLLQRGTQGLSLTPPRVKENKYYSWNDCVFIEYLHSQLGRLQCFILNS